MKRPLLISLTLLAGVGAIASRAEAQEAGYAASVFEPSERGSDWFANESNDYRGKLRLALGAVGDYGYRTVIGDHNPDRSIRSSLLRNQVLVHAGFSLIMADRLRLAVSVPVMLHAFGHPATRNGVDYAPPVHQQGVGDIRTSLDLRIAGEYGDPISLAVGASLFIPVGQRDQFTGDDVTRFAPHLDIAGDADMFAYAFRGGFEYRKLRIKYIDTELGNTITFGGAVGLRGRPVPVVVGGHLAHAVGIDLLQQVAVGIVPGARLIAEGIHRHPRAP